MPVYLSSLLVVAAGFCVVIQQALNASLRAQLNSAVWAGFASYAVGVTCMIAVMVIMREPIPSAAVAARIPWWAWSGGAFGAVFIALAILIVPQIGAATFIALLVAGQMLTSIVFDHYGVLGLAQRSVDLPRLIGVVLLIAGVVLIRR